MYAMIQIEIQSISFKDVSGHVNHFAQVSMWELLSIPGSPADKLCINTKRSTYNYNLPNTVSKTASQVAVIKQETFGKDWTSASPDAGNPEKNVNVFCGIIIFACFHMIINIVNFLQSTHKRHPIAGPRGWGRGVFCKFKVWFNSWPSDAIEWYRFWSTLVQVKACCLMATSL